MDLGLTDRVVVVTAAGAGIGRAIARYLSNEGATVVAVSDTFPEPESGMDSLEVDLLDPAAGEQVARSVVGGHGRLDALVTVLGGPEASASAFGDRGDDRWQRAFEFNVLSGVRTIRACLPALVTSPVGTIVHVGSDLGRQPDPAFVEYGAMKAAILSLSKSLSQELGPRVRSNVLSPGPTRTPGLLADFASSVAPAWGVTTEQAIDRYVRDIRRMPSGRLALPEEVARAAAFLVSPISAPMKAA
jgi:NAD(P)-dependent dehydrogenase (short-subunit alcohol dehydrogenase family)